MGIIYKYTNKVNGKFYVGYTTQKLYKRKNGPYTGYFGNALKKYGWEGFNVEILEKVPTDKLPDAEIKWIAKLKANIIGYNLTTGGEGAPGRKLTKEHKRRIGLANKGNTRKRSEEEKTQISITMKKKGYRPPPITEERKRELSKPIQQLTKDEKIIRNYWGVTEVIREHPTWNRTAITNCAREKTKSSYGFVWRYIYEHI